MIVINPTSIDESNLNSSTIQEPDLATGEREWESVPAVGFDISNDGGTPSFLINLPIRNPTNPNGRAYSVWDTSSRVARDYNKYFAYIGNAFSFPIGISAAGVGIFELVDQVAISNNDATNWPFYEYSIFGLEETVPIKVGLNSLGVTQLDPIGIFARDTETSSRTITILNKVSASEYRVIVYDEQNNLLLSNSTIDSSSHGNPVDITYRNGQFMILFSGATSTKIVIYNDLFSSELSVNPITGDTSDQPYDSFTINESYGYYLLSTSNLKIYNVSSDFNLLSSYVPGDQVVKSSIHKKYQCLIETTQDPEVGVDEVPPTWVEVGTTNKFAMFDGLSTYASESAGDLTVILKPLATIDSIAAISCGGVTEVNIKMEDIDSGGSYSESIDATGKADIVFPSLPQFINPLVTVEFIGDNVSVGELAIGEARQIGTLLAGVVSDRLDYSRYTYDEFGNLTYVPRPIVKYTTYPIRVAKREAIEIERYFDSLKGSQVVWVGDMGGGDLMITRGVIERSPMTYDGPSVIEYTLKVRGSI